MRGVLVTWVVLSVIWVMLTGTLEPTFLLPGLLVSGGAVVITRRILFGREWVAAREELLPPGPEAGRAGALLRRTAWRIAFVPFFLWKVFLSGVGMAVLALRPSLDFWPGIVRVEGGMRTTTGTTLFANLLTLTPGTMTIDYDEKEDVLYLHWIDITGYGEQDFDKRVTGGIRRWMERMEL
ncbi:MAG: Na+/H+ antiporter subunit E [Alkalispirochaetaceae bacterium]